MRLPSGTPRRYLPVSSHCASAARAGEQGSADRQVPARQCPRQDWRALYYSLRRGEMRTADNLAHPAAVARHSASGAARRCSECAGVGCSGRAEDFAQGSGASSVAQLGRTVADPQTGWTRSESVADDRRARVEGGVRPLAFVSDSSSELAVRDDEQHEVDAGDPSLDRSATSRPPRDVASARCPLAQLPGRSPRCTVS
jgi:hypothetical protein